MTGTFEFPNPHHEEQQQALQQVLDRAPVEHEILTQAGLHREAEILAIQRMNEISNRAHTMARTLGLHAIAEGRMSRVELGRLLGVHQGTVAAWIKQAEADPNHDYVKEPLHARTAAKTNGADAPS